jgi:acetyltransferase-like isoleucine patch superfamily enzyme
VITRAYRFLAYSEHWSARLARNSRRAVLGFTLPAPRIVVRPLLALFLAIRATYYFLIRAFVCEPLFKAYCTSYGRNLRTGVFVHWVQGNGRIVIGNNVTVDGKCSFSFASRYAEQATLRIGDNCGIGHGCSFTVGREIRIGRNTRIAIGVSMFDSPGHPANPAARLAGSPATAEDVKPIHIGDNVWIGSGAVIFPGVTIGDGAVVAASAVVMTDVPPYTLVAGNPARQTRALAERAAGQTTGAPQPLVTVPSTPVGPLSRSRSAASL